MSPPLCFQRSFWTPPRIVLFHQGDQQLPDTSTFFSSPGQWVLQVGDRNLYPLWRQPYQFQDLRVHQFLWTLGPPFRWTTTVLFFTRTQYSGLFNFFRRFIFIYTTTLCNSFTSTFSTTYRCVRGTLTISPFASRGGIGIQERFERFYCGNIYQARVGSRFVDSYGDFLCRGGSPCIWCLPEK